MHVWGANNNPTTQNTTGTTEQHHRNRTTINLHISIATIEKQKEAMV